MITKKVVFIAKKENIEELKNLLKTMVIPSQKEQGCIYYEIFQSKLDLTKFLVLESWQDEESLEGHRNTSHYKNYKTNFEKYSFDKYSEELEKI